jgi:hypothetical protein
MRWIAGALLILAAYVAYPFWTIERINSAIANRDATTLNALIDWSAIRSDMKREARGILLKDKSLNDQSKDGMATLGMMIGLGLGGTMIDAMVDTVMTPEALLKLGEKTQANSNIAGKSLWDFVDGVRVISPTMLEISLQSPDPTIKGKAAAILEFQGAQWRVSHLIVPWDEIRQKSDPAAGTRVMDMLRERDGRK